MIPSSRFLRKNGFTHTDRTTSSSLNCPSLMTLRYELAPGGESSTLTLLEKELDRLPVHKKTVKCHSMSTNIPNAITLSEYDSDLSFKIFNRKMEGSPMNENGFEHVWFVSCLRTGFDKLIFDKLYRFLKLKPYVGLELVLRLAFILESTGFK